MVKDKSEKKWLVLLVVLIATVLVVELLSLNVLYSIAKNNDLEGRLHDIWTNPTGRDTSSPGVASEHASSSSVWSSYDPCDWCYDEGSGDAIDLCLDWCEYCLTYPDDPIC